MSAIFYDYKFCILSQMPVKVRHKLLNDNETQVCNKEDKERIKFEKVSAEI